MPRSYEDRDSPHMTWYNLPMGIKRLVVERMDEQTRKTLRCCSRGSRKLVDETRLRVINYMGIGDDYWSPKWYLDIEQRDPRKAFPDYYETSSNFEDIQTVLTRALELEHCVKTLAIESILPRFPFNLGNALTRYIVEHIKLTRKAATRGNHVITKKVLAGIDPNYLKKVEMDVDEMDPAAFDTPQMIAAKCVEIRGISNISEEQLLKLEAWEISMNDINCSVQKFIQKCCHEAATKLPKFTFSSSSFSEMGFQNVKTEAPDNKIFLNTTHLGLKLQLEFGKDEESKKVFVKGGVVYNSESYSSKAWRVGLPTFQIIEHLEVTSDKSKNRKITIRRRFYSQIEHVFETAEELQQKLDEILDNVDLIKYFRIAYEGAEERLNWKRRKDNSLIMVKILDVFGNNSMTYIEGLLRQIDPTFGMSITIKKNEELRRNRPLFDMPQVRNAVLVDIENPYLYDDDFLDSKAQYLFCGGDNGGGRVNEFLTGLEVNQYIQHIFQFGRYKMYMFDLGVVSECFDLYMMLAELEVIQTFEEGGDKHWIVKKPESPYYVLELCFDSKRVVKGTMRHGE